MYHQMISTQYSSRSHLPSRGSEAKTIRRRRTVRRHTRCRFPFALLRTVNEVKRRLMDTIVSSADVFHNILKLTYITNGALCF